MSDIERRAKSMRDKIEGKDKEVSVRYYLQSNSEHCIGRENPR